jgi:hypothetical protein
LIEDWRRDVADKKVLWLTYAWADNKQQDVDFIAQEIEAAGLTVKLDRWNIQAGKRLWDQIAEFIQSPSQCDAWAIVATQASLGSEPCKEEYAYALDRALNQRGATFPVVGIFPSSVDAGLIPPGLRTRLYVSLRDPDWKERIVAATEGRDLNIARPKVEPFALRRFIHEGAQLVEVRPRAGSWSPFSAAVPVAEKDLLVSILPGPAGTDPAPAGVISIGQGERDGLFIRTLHSEITPTQSAYIELSRLPTILHFGPGGGHGVAFWVKLR